ncbi:MAG TPA: DNA mismatch repair protein MutS, partial [Bdellovibrionota bacterium]|nr:DNA mismatch repair protein MutS [Bdellovibrionota bacterium]
KLFGATLNEWEDLSSITRLIDLGINPTPPLTIREGGIIREGYNQELDELIALNREGKGFLSDLEARERARTGIPLKVKFNQVFGFYIEITQSHLSKVPQDYQRRQTLVNAERFITPELKEYEEKALTAEDRRKDLEYELFQEIRQEVSRAGEKIQKMAKILAHLDLISSFAEIARRYQYVKPEVTAGDLIHITKGRHPVVERMLPEKTFIPNDILLDNAKERMLIITGPNMAGKSTVMRQVAVIVLMAQVGSFIPAEAATIGVVDQIFTRVGASDRLAQGESTFMVEMIETANILKRATPKSLIILDEIGRGTSTFDGVSIAWAVAEMIDREIQAKTLFATHYHELTALSDESPNIANYQIAVKEWKAEIIFLHQLIPGATSRSYGIEVGRLAGLPDRVIHRAREILKTLETKKEQKTEDVKDSLKQLDLFSTPHPVLKTLEDLDLSRLTPLEALNRLHDLQTQVVRY